MNARLAEIHLGAMPSLTSDRQITLPEVGESDSQDYEALKILLCFNMHIIAKGEYNIVRNFGVRASPSANSICAVSTICCSHCQK